MINIVTYAGSWSDGERVSCPYAARPRRADRQLPATHIWPYMRSLYTLMSVFTYVATTSLAFAISRRSHAYEYYFVSASPSCNVLIFSVILLRHSSRFNVCNYEEVYATLPVNIKAEWLREYYCVKLQVLRVLYYIRDLPPDCSVVEE